MRSTTKNSPLLTLPYDALSEIALRLPAVGSTKPWRDVNSLATTCKGLYHWKKAKVDNSVKIEWNRVSAEVAKTTGWRDSLEKILSDFEHPSRRWFREPVLRKIAKAEKQSTTAKPVTSVNDFKATLFIKRETASLDEIGECLIVCTDKEIDTNKKNELVTKLQLHLTELKSTDKQMALQSMFKYIDADEELARSLKNNGIFEKVEASMDDDQPSEALLELGLRSRGLLTNKPDLGILGFNLEFIPAAERWNWVVKNVPECLDGTVGMQAMLNDSACRAQMIDYLNQAFSSSKGYAERIDMCERVSACYAKLCDCRDGKKLAKNIVHWFLEGSILTPFTYAPLVTRYMKLLTKLISLVKNYFGNKEKLLLSDRLIEAIQYFISSKEYDRSISIFMALAKENIKLFKKIIFKCKIKNKDILTIMLNIAIIKKQSSVIPILCAAARHHFYSDRIFVSLFIKRAKINLRILARPLQIYD
jgi:hypothetical protein